MDTQVGVRGALFVVVRPEQRGLFGEQVTRQQLLHGVQFVLHLQPELATSFEEALARVRLHRADNCRGRAPMMQCNGSQAGSLRPLRPVVQREVFRHKYDPTGREGRARLRSAIPTLERCCMLCHRFVS